MPRVSREARRAPRTKDTSVDLARLLEVLPAFSRQTICVLGDFVLDEFVSGQISRVSREAPVLILKHRATEAFPGGGANAAVNLSALGARVLAVGAVGDDPGGQTLLQSFQSRHIDIRGIVRVPGWTTPVKSRYLAGWTHTTEQQVLRVDREPTGMLSAKALAAIERNARRAARGAAAVLISDYGFGAATPDLAQKIVAKHKTLDSRYRLLDYRDSGITAATPNEAELEGGYHVSIGSNLGLLTDLGNRALRDLALEALVVTRGRDGLALFERNRSAGADGAQNIPVHGSNEAVDVTGAGDTVIAVFTLAIAAGASYLEAAHLANYAGGIVVMKRRTATLTLSELEDALRSDATAVRQERVQPPNQ